MNTDDIESAVTPILQQILGLIRGAPTWSAAKEAVAPDGRSVIRFLLGGARCAVPFEQDAAARTYAVEVWLTIGELDACLHAHLSLIEPALDALEIGPVDAKSAIEIDEALQKLALVAGFIGARHFGGSAPILTTTALRYVASQKRLEAILARPDAPAVPRVDVVSIVPQARAAADELYQLAIASHRLAIVRQAMGGPLITTMAPVGSVN